MCSHNLESEVLKEVPGATEFIEIVSEIAVSDRRLNLALSDEEEPLDFLIASLIVFRRMPDFVVNPTFSALSLILGVSKYIGRGWTFANRRASIRLRELSPQGLDAVVKFLESFESDVRVSARDWEFYFANTVGDLKVYAMERA